MSSNWTRNYDNMFCALFGYGSLSYNAISTATHSKPLVRTILGNYKTPYVGSKSVDDNSNAGPYVSLALGGEKRYLTSNNETQQYSTYGTYSCVQIGASDTPVSYDDYKLYEPHLNNLSVNTSGIKIINNGYKSDTHSYSFTIKIPIGYSGNSNITVREFGLFGSVRIASANYVIPVLYYREVLENEIVLEPNDTIEITITQSIVQPNYTPYPDNSTIV